MSGIKFLLDTNIIIGLTKGNPQVLQLLQSIDQGGSINTNECAYNFITRIELLGYPTITPDEITGITSVLSGMTYLPMSSAIEDMTIQIRQRYTLKMPDAIIAATAKVHQLELLTLDQQLAKRMVEIVSR